MAETDRLQAFLDDRLQTAADLANLGSLLEDVQRQHDLLQEQTKLTQLSAVQATLQKSRKHTEEHALRERIRGFRKAQADIDRRLAIVVQSETSDDAVAQLAETEQQVDRLDIAHAYLDVLERAQQLRETASSQSLSEALQAHDELQQLGVQLDTNGTPQLVHTIKGMAVSAWTEIKDSHMARFEQVLERIAWPQLDRPMSVDVQIQWCKEVDDLLRIQHSSPGGAVLLPLEALVKPLELRFQYHFEGDQPTNKLERAIPDPALEMLTQPEFFLSHVSGLIAQYDEFLSTHLQPRLSPIQLTASNAFITALLPMLRRKLFSILPQVSSNPQLFSHLIHQVVAFDANLRDDWVYDEASLAQDVFAQDSWFPQWLSVEKDFALNRYHAIIDTPGAFDIDYDAEDSDRPTFAAVRVHDLLETITDCYRSLTSFQQQLQFLIDIQISLFDLFHARLGDSLIAYQSMSSSLGRNVQADALAGVNGLERLCRVLGSADYLERKMRDWGDDIFFLELWDELQHRARRKQMLTISMSVSHVADKTSASIASEDLDGALFDETAGAYRKLRIRAVALVQERLTRQMRDAVKPYGRLNPCDTELSTIPPELGTLLAFLQENLSLLHRCLSSLTLREISWNLCAEIQTFFWHSVLLRYKFSAAGGTALARDVRAVSDVINRIVGQGHAEYGLPRLYDALKLLTLPDINDDGFEAWEEADTEQQGAERRLFRSEHEAREVMAELGIETHSVADARLVCKQRLVSSDDS